MLFSSLTFISIFLPIVCVLYYLIRPQYRNFVLLAASILFYAWGEPVYVAIMLLTILTNFVGALVIDRYRKFSTAALVVTIFVDLGVLFYFKYFNFLVENLNALFRTDIDFIKVVMPIGISFYTFQAISYIVDVYRRDTPVQDNVFKLALYICLFPQLIAGPIVKYNDIAHQIDERSVDFGKVVYGVRRFIVGLSKKVLIANTLGSVADEIFGQEPATMGCLVLWLGAICYSLQLFFDFSGYSDMAIGLGKMFGFDFKENFNYPYISKSITEFWRRWHISLSSWFREYLYIPLGGNRRGKVRTYLNLFIVFLLTGFWHGAAWTFIWWGVWNGVFIVMERMTGLNKSVSDNPCCNGLKHLYTIVAFVVGWVLFRSDTMEYAWNYIKGMSGLLQQHDVLYTVAHYIDVTQIAAMSVAVLCSSPLLRNIIQLQEASTLRKVLTDIFLVICLLACMISIASSTYNPFIYFRF